MTDYLEMLFGQPGGEPEDTENDTVELTEHLLSAAAAAAETAESAYPETAAGTGETPAPASADGREAAAGGAAETAQREAETAARALVRRKLQTAGEAAYAGAAESAAAEEKTGAETLYRALRRAEQAGNYKSPDREEIVVPAGAADTLSARQLDREVERDARRYDNGFELY